jgi:hypothetical protein
MTSLFTLNEKNKFMGRLSKIVMRLGESNQKWKIFNHNKPPLSPTSHLILQLFNCCFKLCKPIGRWRRRGILQFQTKFVPKCPGEFLEVRLLSLQSLPPLHPPVCSDPIETVGEPPLSHKREGRTAMETVSLPTSCKLRRLPDWEIQQETLALNSSSNL